jgi:hypothetical protein
MPEISFSDPVQVLLFVGLAVGVVVLAALLWQQLLHRSRRYGGGLLAAAAMAFAVLALLAAIAPNLLPFEIGLFLLFVALASIYRPDQVVKLTGGPSLRYRALREGRELQLLVRERGGWSVARRNEEVKARFEALSGLEGSGTERYVGLLRETLLTDPERPGMDRRLAELAEAEAELRASLKARPMFERELERRAALLDGGSAADEARTPS